MPESIGERLVADPSSSGTEGDRVVPRSARGRWIVLAVLAVALLIRIAAVAENSPYTPATDALTFDETATSLVDGHGFGYSQLPPLVWSDHQATAFRAPGYPLLLAAVFEVVGAHPHIDASLAGAAPIASSGAVTAGRLFNAFIGMLDVLLIGVVAAQLWGRRVAFAAMLLAAIDPTLILIASGLGIEPLLIVLCLAGLAAALQHRRHPRGLWWPVAAGVALGLGTLTRELALLFVLPVAWLVWTADRRGRSVLNPSALLSPLLVIVLTVVVVVPWTIRNAVELHAFVPVSTSDGTGLAGTYNETSVASRVNQADWIPPWEDPTIGDSLLALKDPTEAKIDSVLRKAVFSTISKHPTYPFRAAFWNSERLFGFDLGHYSTSNAKYEPYSKNLVRVAIYIDYVLFVLAIVGLFFKQARRAPKAIWVIPILSWVFIVFFLTGYIRYESFIEPFVVLAAAFPLLWIIERAFPLWTGFEGIGVADPELAAVGRVAHSVSRSKGPAARPDEPVDPPVEEEWRR